jgi:hypothetical protein
MDGSELDVIYNWVNAILLELERGHFPEKAVRELKAYLDRLRQPPE